MVQCCPSPGAHSGVYQASFTRKRFGPNPQKWTAFTCRFHGIYMNGVEHKKVINNSNNLLLISLRSHTNKMSGSSRKQTEQPKNRLQMDWRWDRTVAGCHSTIRY